MRFLIFLVLVSQSHLMFAANTMNPMILQLFKFKDEVEVIKRYGLYLSDSRGTFRELMLATQRVVLDKRAIPERIKLYVLEMPTLKLSEAIDYYSRQEGNSASELAEFKAEVLNFLQEFYDEVFRNGSIKTIQLNTARDMKYIVTSQKKLGFQAQGVHAQILAEELWRLTSELSLTAEAYAHLATFADLSHYLSEGLNDQSWVWEMDSLLVERTNKLAGSSVIASADLGQILELYHTLGLDISDTRTLSILEQRLKAWADDDSSVVRLAEVALITDYSDSFQPIASEIVHQLWMSAFSEEDFDTAGLNKELTDIVMSKYEELALSSVEEYGIVVE